MVILLTGASCTGKTNLAQAWLERYNWPYLSIDHLKMGLIRSGVTILTPEEDGALTEYMWPILREMIKTVVENGQHLVVEGGYIPPDWEKSFTPEYLAHIRCLCLVMSERYIRSHWDDIEAHARVIEHRPEAQRWDRESLVKDNAWYGSQFRQAGGQIWRIDSVYEVPLDWPGDSLSGQEGDRDRNK